MPSREPSEFRDMWVFALFDLPVTTREHRREYTHFRKALLTRGFVMLQYSVYARHSVSEEAVESARAHIRMALPPHGQVRLLAVTDHQFGKMEVYFGRKRKATEEPPAQMLLF
ncbi:MAG: CRISPR-associated endonuclease Cas2 [Acidobacteria bacterium]|nr:CRISPR-associated endonuclease Cas2 [Acidobacteriota bacterium]